MKSLPIGWAHAKLGDLALWGSGGTPSRSNPAFFGGAIPWIKTGELGPRVLMSTEEHITEDALAQSSAKLFPAGSIALAMYGATIGKTSILGISAATNQACAVGIPYKGIIAGEYLYHYLVSQKEAFICAGQGGAQPNISQAVVKAWPAPLAPLAEQARIADKLDTVLTRVDACRDRLARVAPLLKRFRQSVLAAATSGRLTEDWRGGRSDHGQWNLTTFGAVATDLRYGTSKKCDVENKGVAVLRIPNVGDHGLPDLTSLKYAEFEDAEHNKSSLRENDLLVIRSNGSVDLVGKTCVVNQSAVGLSFAGYLMRLRLDLNRVQARFAYFVLSSPVQRQRIERLAKSTSGVNNINSEELRSLPIFLPPLEEQTEIVRRVETLFAFADRLEARLKTAQTAADRLTPALLAKAFRGELVPQDPNDEPAAELLKRLAASRDAAPKAKRGRRSATADTTP